MVKRRKPKRTLLRGIGAARGVARGPACVLITQEFKVPTGRIAANEIPAEIRRLRAALRGARESIASLRAELGKDTGDPAKGILESHQMILQDRVLQREIIAAIQAERMNAAHAVRSILTAKAHYLESLQSEVFSARAADIRDVERRLLGHFLGDEASVVAQLPTGSIVVASELSPSDTAALDPARIAAFVTERGTLASHVTILARSRGIPAVVGVPGALERITDGVTLIVDGERGAVIISPTRVDLTEFAEVEKYEAGITKMLGTDAPRPGETRDGKRITVEANIESPAGAEIAHLQGAEGIGLFRTEFIFMGSVGFPPEERQCEAYAQVARTFGEQPVTIRTIDLGGDKTAALMGQPREANPFLGLRGIRFCFENPEVFRTQVRAILRTAPLGNLRMMLPMISNLEQLQRARTMVTAARDELVAEGLAIPERIAIGVMIEVPSAVIMSDVLARACDFFSIGSNDLIQYTLVVDRGNEHIAHLYDPIDPAVLRSIAQTIANAHAAGIAVGSCGELSGDTLGTLLLTGLGIDALSVTPTLVRRVKGLLSQVRARDLTRLAERCLAAESATEVKSIIRESLAGDEQFVFEEREGRLLCQWRPGTAAQKGK